MGEHEEENRHDDGVRHTTQAERDRAEAVNSIDDETRMHADPDETDVVQGAGGELRSVDDEEEPSGPR